MTDSTGPTAATDLDGALRRLLATLPDAATAEQVGTHVLAALGNALGCEAGWVARLESVEDRLIGVACVGIGPGTWEWLQARTSPAGCALVRAATSGDTLWLSDRADVAARLPGLAELLPGLSGLVLEPLTVGGALVGVIGLHFDRPRPARDGDREFLLAAARLSSSMLERIWSRAAERAATARACAAEARAEHLAELAAALAATVTAEDVAAALDAHLQQAVECQTFSLRAIHPAEGVARAIRVGGVTIGYQGRFTDVRLDLPSALAEVASIRRPVFLRSAEENRRRYGIEDAERYEASRGEAIARLPLLVEDELIAILSVAWWAPRDYDETERQFLTTVANLAAQALGRAVRTEKLRVEARRHRLSSAAQAAINRRLDPADQLRALGRVVVPELADYSTVHVLRHPVPPGVPPALPVITDRIAAEVVEGVEPTPLQTDLAWWADDPITRTVAASGLLTEPIPTPAVPVWASRTGTTATFVSGLNHLVLAQVLVDGMVVAVACFGMCHDRPKWDEHDLAIIAEIAGYAAVALEHGLTYQHTRETALVLQRSLLSAPPTVAGLELCARYEPAGRDEVGGDWYDAFETAPGRLALAVGDVVGHDITAAAAMGQLRAVLRALAMDESLDPGEVLDRLAEANRFLGITDMATVSFARLTRQEIGWTLDLSSAGHPPPVLAVPGDEPQPLPYPSGLALVHHVSRPHATHRVFLERPGTLLLLYTDGVVERRGVDMRDSIDELCTRTGMLTGVPLPDLCDQILRVAPSSDDRALLAVRLAARE